eukprot:COSAG06_NODE_69_length_26016_cov_6.603272_7_plen_88_part_00
MARYAPGEQVEDAIKYAELTTKLERAEKEHRNYKQILENHNARNMILRSFINHLLAVGVALKDLGEDQMMVRISCLRAVPRVVHRST